MIGLVTYAKQPALTDDDRPLISALQQLGIDAVAVRWDDDAMDPAGYKGLVLRSTWDYHLRVAEFERWLGRVEAAGVPLWNPAALVRWNLHKRYLRDLSDAGVLIPRTQWFTRGTAVVLRDVMDSEGWSDAIVKPAISASATDTWRVTAEDADDAARFDDLLRRSDVLVQELIPEVAAVGEWSLMFIGGAFSHATLKRPRTGDFRVQTELGGSAVPASASAEAIATGAAILSHLPHPPLYARIDGVVTARGFMLMEAECIEPVLFFAHAAGSYERFATALAERVTTNGR
jgi:glutathione synthase/RimK-type ligase-like ATP-grasp enzyme